MAFGPRLGRGGVQAQAEDARTAEWARAFDGDDEEEVPLLPSHLEAQWIVLSCEPWNIILNLSAYIGRVVVDMWDFKEKLAVRAVLPCARGPFEGRMVFDRWGRSLLPERAPRQVQRQELHAVRRRDRRAVGRRAQKGHLRPLEGGRSLLDLYVAHRVAPLAPFVLLL